MHRPTTTPTDETPPRGDAGWPRIGAHVSVVGGILNAPRNAVEATCEAFQMWLSSPRAWRPPTLDRAVDQRFRQLVADADLGPVFVHAPYLVNFASTSDATFDELDKVLNGRIGLVHTTSG